MMDANEAWPFRELARNLPTQEQQDSHPRLGAILLRKERSKEKTAAMQGCQ